MSVHVVRGDDALLRSDALDRLVERLLGDDDRSMAMEEHTVPGRSIGPTATGAAPAGADDPGVAGAERSAVVAAIVNAAATPPFMTGCRVVVARDAGNLTAADAELLYDYLAAPVPTTALVVEASGGRLPANLTKALKSAGAEDVGPTATATGDVLAERLREAGLKLRPSATKAVTAHLGDEVGRAPALVEVLRGAFGPGATLDVDDIGPYLGEAGAVPVYTLTDAIESGDVPRVLAVLHRLLRAPQARDRRVMQPLQVLGSLHNHYARMLRLDDPALRTPKDAVAALGGKVKEYPARKALDAARALGTDGLRAAFDHLARADLDLKGARAIPEETVLEVLVARLAGLARIRRQRAR